MTDKFIFRNKEENLTYEWLDKDTFLFCFGQYKDEENDEYYISVEFWKDEGSWHFNKVYDYDIINIKEEQFVTEDEIKYIINTASAVM